MKQKTLNLREYDEIRRIASLHEQSRQHGTDCVAEYYAVLAKYHEELNKQNEKESN